MDKLLEFKRDGDVCTSLSNSDPELKNLINMVGDYSLDLRTDYFASLLRAIIGQQLSAKAARTIWQRVINLAGDVKPEMLIDISDEKLKSAGVSRPKIAYIRGLSLKVINNEIVLEELPYLSEEELIDVLTSIKGVGKWTAEMFMIFSLGKLDILSAGDVGLQRAARWLYNCKDKVDEDCLKAYGERWRPYRTVASLYLWEAINRGYI